MVVVESIVSSDLAGPAGVLKAIGEGGAVGEMVTNGPRGIRKAPDTREDTVLT